MIEVYKWCVHNSFLGNVPRRQQRQQQKTKRQRSTTAAHSNFWMKILRASIFSSGRKEKPQKENFCCVQFAMHNFEFELEKHFLVNEKLFFLRPRSKIRSFPVVCSSDSYCILWMQILRFFAVRIVAFMKNWKKWEIPALGSPGNARNSMTLSKSFIEIWQISIFQKISNRNSNFQGTLYPKFDFLGIWSPNFDFSRSFPYKFKTFSKFWPQIQISSKFLCLRKPEDSCRFKKLNFYVILKFFLKKINWSRGTRGKI